MSQKTLIVYASKRGSTKDVVFQIARLVNVGVDLYDCKSKLIQSEISGAMKGIRKISFNEYGLIIIGTPMYMGAPLGAVKHFCTRYESELLTHELAFFTCGVGSEQEDSEYLRSHLPVSLLDKALLYQHMGGEIRKNKMNLLEKIAMKEYVKQFGPASGINHEAIERACAAINMNYGRS